MREAWYLTDVRSKTNKHWSDDEKMDIYELCQKRSSSEVARMQGLSLIQVYNVTRQVKKAKDDKCYVCGDILSDGDKRGTRSLVKACKKCKKEASEYKKQLRVKALKKHLCSYCHKEPIIPGFTGCRKCLSATHRRRYLQGLCGACGKNPVAHAKGALCTECCKRLRTSVRKLRLNKLSIGTGIFKRGRKTCLHK